MSCILTCFLKDGKYLGMGTKKHNELVRIHILVTSRTVVQYLILARDEVIVSST
jgi:hypothetical protein